MKVFQVILFAMLVSAFVAEGGKPHEEVSNWTMIVLAVTTAYVGLTLW